MLNITNLASCLLDHTHICIVDLYFLVILSVFVIVKYLEVVCSHSNYVHF